MNQVNLLPGQVVLLRARNSMTNKDQVSLHFVSKDNRVNVVAEFQQSNDKMKGRGAGVTHGFSAITKKDLQRLIASGALAGAGEVKNLLSLPVRTVAGPLDGWKDVNIANPTLFGQRMRLQVSFTTDPNENELARKLQAPLQFPQADGTRLYAVTKVQRVDENKKPVVDAEGKPVMDDRLVYRRVSVIAGEVRAIVAPPIEQLTESELFERGLISAPAVEETVEDAVNMPV